MENCLTTKYKGVTDNNNLMRPGTLRLEFTLNKFNTENSQYIQIQTLGDPMTVEIVGDGYITEDITVPTSTKKVNINTNINKKLYISNTNCFVDIYPYYDGARIGLGGSSNNMEFDYKNIVNPIMMTYMNKLEYLILREIHNISFDIGLIGSSILANLDLNSSRAYGNFSDLKANGTLHNLSIRNTNIAGDLDDVIPMIASTNVTIDVRNTSKMVKRKSTIDSLREKGFTVLVSDNEIIED